MAKNGDGAAAVAAATAVVVEELPRAIVRRVVKEKLTQLSGEEDVTVHKDALLALAESTRIFIHYLSAAANDICKDSKRQTMNADDVLKALEEIDFPEFIDPLQASLAAFRRKNGTKRSASKAKETDNKKRKLEEDLPEQNGEDDAEDADEEEHE